MPKIRIALFWTKYDGSTTSVNDLIWGLDPSRYDVLFIYLRGRGAAENAFEKAGYKVVHLTRKNRVPSFSIPIVRRLTHTLKEHGVDILHCHTRIPTMYGTIAGWLAGTPIVLSQVHGLKRTRNLRRRLVNLLVFRRTARILCVAEAVRQDVIKTNWRMNPQKLLVLENSVDYERFAKASMSREEARGKLDVSAEDFVFGTIGRLVPTKGLPYLLDAFAIVKQQVPSAQLVLLGEGYSRADLEQQAARMPCRQAIHFLGHRPGVEGLLKGLDAFVLSSVAEGMPRAILEAMAAGLPCVATKVGGIPEVLNDPSVGFLAPPRDATALAQRLIEVARMASPERAAIGTAARERIRTCYSHEVIQQKLAQIYERELMAHEVQRKAGP